MRENVFSDVSTGSCGPHCKVAPLPAAARRRALPSVASVRLVVGEAGGKALRESTEKRKRCVWCERGKGSEGRGEMASSDESAR